MKILIQHDTSTGERGLISAKTLASELSELGFQAKYSDGNGATASQENFVLVVAARPVVSKPHCKGVCIAGAETLMERALQVLPLDFDSLPLLVEGESKIVRLWTDKVVVMRFKPTVYSFTANRYGNVPGSEITRVKFTAALFRLMASARFDGAARPRSAFLAEIESPHCGPLLVEKRVTDCNLETRVKRYHIGSPVHRYLYTDRFPSTQSGDPISRWSRFDSPVVCFDWRHPLLDADGNRLADEPLSDDYAAIWMHNTSHAKEIARRTFLWMEKMYEDAGLRLIDMCIFIDRDGRTIFGEISPDCMRVRLNLEDPSKAEAADKDLWRIGAAPDKLQQRYTELYERLFAFKKIGKEWNDGYGN